MSHIEDLALEIDYLRGDLAKRDTEIERLREALKEMVRRYGFNSCPITQKAKTALAGKDGKG